MALRILAILMTGLLFHCCSRLSPVPVAAEVEVAADSTPTLAILYRGEVYRVTDIQLAPDGRTFLAQFRTVKKVKTRRTK